MNEEEFNRRVGLVEVTARRRATDLTGNRENAEDLLQESRIKAWINRDKFDCGRDFNRWFLRLMYHIFIDNIRMAQVRVKTVHLENYEKSEDAPPYMDNETSVSNPYSIIEDRDFINALTSHLEPRNKTILFSYFLEEKSFAEIAKEHGLSQGHISVLIKNCIAEVKSAYADEE